MTYERNIEDIQKFDMVNTAVISKSTKGVFLNLGKNIKAFAYANLPIGTRVFATVKKVDRENPYVLLSIDSVLEF